MAKVTFEIKERIGVITEKRDGWSFEVNIVSWNGGEAKVDLRDWNEDHTLMSRPHNLTKDEAKKLVELLTNYFKEA